MTERRIFNLYKRLPGIGIAYGAVRGAVYAFAGDKDERNYSLEMDPADLNPLRAVRNIVNSWRSWDYDLDEGIWIGKRAIGGQLVAVTLSPGMDVHHWCIQINGIIYEVGGEKSKININIISKNANPKEYKSYCKRFSWTMLQSASSSVSATTLRDYAKSFEDYNYRLLMANGDKINCQTFVMDMFAEAANLTDDEAQIRILAVMPNLIV